MNSLKNRKAPGLDVIPGEALKVLLRACPQLVLDMYNGCLKQGDFCKPWKAQRLVLIGKMKGDPNTACAYKLLCMLDTVGKVLEKLMKPRLR